VGIHVKSWGKKYKIRDWAKKTLIEAKINKGLQNVLYKAAEKVIKDGGLRGDVSDKWVAMGYKEIIPGLFL